MSREFAVGDGRLHLRTGLMAESLVDPDCVDATAIEHEESMIPDANFVAIGGRSIVDRGRAAVMPLLEDILVAREGRKLILGVSGGARVRHTFEIGLDLGIPTGGLAQLAGACEEQNAAMLQTLLAKHQSVFLTRDHFTDLPLYLNSGIIPIIISVPPYHYWEPPSKGRLPENGSDLGIFLSAEAVGAERIVFVKDQTGLYTDDPVNVPDAEFIPRIGTRTLMERNLPSLIVDRTLIETLHNAHLVKEIQIIDGLVPGNLPRALDGEHVGTIIYQED